MRDVAAVVGPIAIRADVILRTIAVTIVIEATAIAVRIVPVRLPITITFGISMRVQPLL